MSVNFTLEDRPGGGKPSVFAASFLYMTAMMGLWFAQFAAYPINFILSRILPEMTEQTQNTVSQIVYYLLFIILPVVLYTKKHPSCAVSMRINPISGKAALLCVLASAVGVLFINYITSIWVILIEAVGGTVTQSGISMPENIQALAGMVIFVGVMPGICEEVLFRGVMLGAWEEKGSLSAMLIVSMWFTFLHASIEGIPAEFVSGLILAFVVISTDSLFAGMIYHTVHNSLCLIIAYIANGAEIAGEGAHLAESASMLESIGGFFGLLVLLFYIGGTGALLLFILKRIDKIRIRQERFEFGVNRAQRREMPISEVLVIAACGIVAFMMYLMNFLEIVGIIS
ncbi:MAG: CPBP family intramembrane metalloprotease [Clostridia bacterium]|nr:CPBP family intramembrane metalloprotease [Clostridia bacterium]